MSEHELLMKIVLNAKRLGLLVFHTYDGFHVVEPGFPDLVIVGPSGFLFAELKSLLGVRSLVQLRWSRLLREAHAPYFSWKPDDWHTGHIQRELNRIAMRELKAA